MKIGHFGPTFIFPGKTVNFFGVKHVAPSSTLKMRKSHKKSARVYAYTHAYTQLRDGGLSTIEVLVYLYSCIRCGCFDCVFGLFGRWSLMDVAK